MQIELKSLQREVGISFLFVTHDQEEAMALSDRIALLRAGGLEQVASPREIYSRPASAYTAQFIGQTNLLRGRVEQGWMRCGSLAWQCAPGAFEDGPATFSLRPENIRIRGGALEQPVSEGVAERLQHRPDGKIGPKMPDDRVRFRACIRHQIFGGATDLLEVTCSDGQVLLARIPCRGNLQGEQEFEFSVVDVVPVRDEV
jgi:ABC-type Fe3+/spermidine/putrescine transport system ATPase subunit